MGGSPYVPPALSSPTPVLSTTQETLEELSDDPPAMVSAPEPSTLVMYGLGLAAFSAFSAARRARRRQLAG